MISVSVKKPKPANSSKKYKDAEIAAAAAAEDVALAVSAAANKWQHQQSKQLSPQEIVDLLAALEEEMAPMVLEDDLPGLSSPGRHCHSTRSLAAVGCHFLAVHTVILLSLQSFFAKMTVLPRSQA